jgi:ribosomal-protein-alanine N-acetyltransferase
VSTTGRTPLFEDLPLLGTDRLLLRKLRPDDLDRLHTINSDPEVARYMGWRASESLDESREYLDDTLERYDRHYPAPWGIELQSASLLVGRCGFETWHLADSRAEVSFALARPYWGAGYATEALRAVIDYGFADVGLNRIEGQCARENVASMRVMEKNGMRLEGIHRQQRFAQGTFRDMVVLAILRQEWESKGFTM